MAFADRAAGLAVSAPRYNALPAEFSDSFNAGADARAAEEDAPMMAPMAKEVCHVIRDR
ncbi:hypothetical protein ACMDCR_29445 [Labrys okinawensis]|uniref:hypothetical protein n=1 Tax=Labrys okinawensis TaxID=346911 RepID=UPI0039BD4FEE